MKTLAQHIPCLDGLRAASIVLVPVGHALNTVDPRGRRVSRVESVLSNATTGVAVFFVIRGYLITNVLCAEWQRTLAVDWRGFYLRRILRVFPAFYSYIAVAVALASLGALTQGNPRMDAAWQKLERLGAPAPVAATFLFVVSPDSRAVLRGGYQITVGMLAVFSVAFLVLWPVRRSDGAIGRRLQKFLVVHQEVLSYSLYNWQQFFPTGRFSLRFLRPCRPHPPLPEAVLP